MDNLPPPRLRVYPRATVVAEKLEAIVSLGMANSRMKDYFDLIALAREGALSVSVLTEAIAATFARRHTVLPDGIPIGLSNEFARDVLKQRQWSAFLKKNRIEAPGLDEVVAEVRRFVAEPLRLTRQR